MNSVLAYVVIEEEGDYKGWILGFNFQFLLAWRCRALHKSNNLCGCEEKKGVSVEKEA